VEWHGLLAHAYSGDVAVDPLPNHGSHYDTGTNTADFPDKPHGTHIWKSSANNTNTADFPDKPHGTHTWKSSANTTKRMLSGLYAREGVW
jgi:hypothetical protein